MILWFDDAYNKPRATSLVISLSPLPYCLRLYTMSRFGGREDPEAMSVSCGIRWCSAIVPRWCRSVLCCKMQVVAIREPPHDCWDARYVEPSTTLMPLAPANTPLTLLWRHHILTVHGLASKPHTQGFPPRIFDFSSSCSSRASSPRSPRHR